MAQIIIVRHGETDWNRTERFRGMVDIDLNETGRRQAAATADRLARLPVSMVYSSPVGRAMETARTIAAPLNKKVQVLQDIRDICFGKMDGMSFEDAELNYREVFNKWLSDPQDVKFPGGESLAEVRGRASAAVEEIIKGLDEEIVVLVSHKVVIIELIIHFLGLKDSQFRQIGQDTCAVNIFQTHKDRIYAILLNDTCHLQGIES